MNKLEISPNFTIDDIHKIRKYNYEITKDMLFEDMKAYYDKGAENALNTIAKLRKDKELLAE